MNLNHLHLRVLDVARAEAFYVRHFGMRRHAVHDDGVVFVRDQAGMDFALAPATRVEPMPGWFHIGFRLESHDAVAALYAQTRADGVNIRAPLTREGDFSFFRCVDPDGYVIEVYYEPDQP